MTALVMRSLTTRKFRILLVVLLAILTLQSWSGDTVNIFYAPSSGIAPPPYSFSGFFSAVEGISLLLVWHVVEGISLAILAVAVFVLSFVWSKSKGVRITSGLGLFFVVLAAVGGFDFVMGGFANGGDSAQMATGFLGAFISYFLALYYSRNLPRDLAAKTSDGMQAEIVGGGRQ
jgi:heme A synthase